jgi:hypothetical protein
MKSKVNFIKELNKKAERVFSNMSMIEVYREKYVPLHNTTHLLLQEAFNLKESFING